MAVISSTLFTYACDRSGCATTLENTTPGDAGAAGWTYAAQSFAVNAATPQPSVRCPAHKGQ